MHLRSGVAQAARPFSEHVVGLQAKDDRGRLLGGALARHMRWHDREDVILATCARVPGAGAHGTAAQMNGVWPQCPGRYAWRIKSSGISGVDYGAKVCHSTSIAACYIAVWQILSRVSKVSKMCQSYEQLC